MKAEPLAVLECFLVEQLVGSEVERFATFPSKSSMICELVNPISFNWRTLSISSEKQLQVISANNIQRI